ncbi:hypothetical protein ENSA5_06570 [Enhygromyxa salina]|uniref:Rhomboid family protein n=1 Tax=Enhygromyxa salina TaxID=215803 RepID=A0A2S9YHE0_9BACT|nr:hypothetical protein [Enhygromyxa salina]PRQ04533.1 hypothetical protein ENSA5_06570 [Enhygromyxa salina]
MLPRFRRGAFALFALVFLTTMLLGDRSSFDSALTLRPAQVLDGHQWWTPLSALFHYPEGLGLVGLLWTLSIQWVIGSRLEGFWGTTRYLIMVLVAGLVGYGAVLGLGLGFGASVPALAYAGPGPLDTAAVVAFAWVFANERMKLNRTEISPLLVAGVAGPISVGFPLLVTLVAGTPIAQAWPSLIPGAVAAAVATVFVQPWRKREKSGKVGPTKLRGQPHLRVIRTPDDMLN